MSAQAAPMGGNRLSEKAAELHNEMINSQPPGYMFRQPELQDLVRVKNVNELMRYVQELTDSVSREEKASLDLVLISFCSIFWNSRLKVKRCFSLLFRLTMPPSKYPLLFNLMIPTR